MYVSFGRHPQRAHSHTGVSGHWWSTTKQPESWRSSAGHAITLNDRADISFAAYAPISIYTINCTKPIPSAASACTNNYGPVTYSTQDAGQVPIVCNNMNSIPSVKRCDACTGPNVEDCTRATCVLLYWKFDLNGDKTCQACKDDPKWLDTRNGDGTTKCADMPGHYAWCHNKDEWTAEARLKCPYSCGLCPGNPMDKNGHLKLSTKPPKKNAIDTYTIVLIVVLSLCALGILYMRCQNSNTSTADNYWNEGNNTSDGSYVALDDNVNRKSNQM